MRGPLGFFLAAVLGILSFPPIGLWPLAYVAMVPFLAAATSLPPKRARRWAFLAGLVFFGGLLYWIGLNSGAPAALSAGSAAAVVLILGTVWSLTAWAVSKIAQRQGAARACLLFVALYMFFEVFWGTGELGFPWAVWGLSQIDFLPAVQIADLGDVYIISLWVLCLNALIFLLWTQKGRRRRYAISATLLFLIAVIYGFERLMTVQGEEPVAVAAVQANTPVDDKWQMPAEDIARSYLDATRPVTGTAVRLAVWPETATPTPLRYRAWLRNSLQQFCDSTGITLLTGASDYKNTAGEEPRPYNAAFLIRPREAELLSSAKIQLVPFGERIPGQRIFPFLHSLHLGQAEWVPGDSVVVFPAQNGIPALGCLICFEVVFPEIAADMVKRGARLLTTITNDGWYGNSSGPYQHLALSRIRAIATRRSIVRSANTGISALIWPTGEMPKTLAYNRAGHISGVVYAASGVTLACRLAHYWLAIYSAGLAVVLAFLYLRSRRDGGR